MLVRKDCLTQHHPDRMPAISRWLRSAATTPPDQRREKHHDPGQGSQDAFQQIRRRLILLIQVSRPLIWPVLPLVYALGLHEAHAGWSIPAIIQMALLTFPMNLIGCGLNDIYDYESDRRSPRRRAVWGAVISGNDRR